MTGENGQGPSTSPPSTSNETPPLETTLPLSEPGAGSEVKVEFRRDLKVFDITMIGIGAMIGAGIFVLIGIAAGLSGPATMLAFLLNGIINLLTAMTYAELGSAMPTAGGSYYWIRKGLPPPFGFVSGWTSWFGATVACSLYSLGFGTYLAWLLEEYMHFQPLDFFIGLDKIIAVIVAIFLLYINYAGTSAAGNTENIFTFSKIVILVIFIGFGIFAMFQNPRALDNLVGDFFPKGSGGVLFAMGITFIAFQGFEVISQTGEEVQNPSKSIPKAIFISLAVVVAIYIIMVVVLFGIITDDMLASTGSPNPTEYLGASGEGGETALVEIALAAMGLWGVILILIGGFLSTLSALNATIFSSSRIAFAMGRDGTLPKRLGILHPKKKTPANALLFSGVILIIMVLFFPIATIAGSASVMYLILYAMTNASSISLRYKNPNLKRGFKVPLFPLLPIIAIILDLVLIYPIFIIEPMAFYIGLLWIMIGATIYFFTGAQKEILETPLKTQEMEETIKPEKVDRYRVLIPIKNLEQKPLIELAGIIAKARDGDLSLLNIVDIPKATPASAVGYRDVKDQIQDVEVLEKYAKKMDVNVDAKLLISHGVAPTIVDTAQREDAEVVILGWHGLRKMGVVMGTNIDRIVSNVDSDVVVFKSAGLKEKLKNIFLLHGHDWHVSHAADLAAIYAKKHGATVTILHISQTGEPSEDDVRQNERLAKIIQKQDVKVEIRQATHADLVNGVVYETIDADLLFMGAAESTTFGRTLFGDVRDKIAKQVRCPVIILKKVAKDKKIDGVDMVE